MTAVRHTVSGILSGTVDFETGLDLLTVTPAPEVDPVLTGTLRDAVVTLVTAGWQPVELHRVVARQGDPVQAHLVTDAIAAHLAGFAQVDPRWRAQADELGARVWWADGDDYLSEAARRWRLDRIALLDDMLTLLTTLRTLPPLEVLIPPPGTSAPSPASRTDPRLLHRVRSLLAKAEATDFPAEAESYTAKAQELIARYSIEDALAPHTAEVVPFARRIGLDHPYESEKASLLSAVARANRCHTVWSPELGVITVFGFDADIDAVELLYTSLLVQSHRAMTRDEPRAGKARLKAFRRSFLIAYAVRIGERLRQTRAAAEAHAPDLLPALVSRDTKVRETMERVFPRTERARGTRIDSEEGWDSGRDAADRAQL